MNHEQTIKLQIQNRGLRSLKISVVCIWIWIRIAHAGPYTCCTYTLLRQAFSEVLEKNYRHYSNPDEDLVMDLDEDEHTAACNFYAKDQFESLEVANNAVLKGAWGKIGDDELKSVNLAGLETTDQEKLEAKEAK
jgi:hypothetical protein